MVNYFEGVGITARELVEGTPVMVPVGADSALVNGHPCAIAWAVVVGPAEDGKKINDPDAKWWLDVYTIPGGPPLPQMYPAGQILGVPALGLSMRGAPPHPAEELLAP
jgi:hypothetical protein